MPQCRTLLLAMPIQSDLAEATVSEGRGIRYLHLGTPWIQGAMRMSKPDAIELDYVQRMMVWLLLRPLEEWQEQRALQLGLGAAAITRFCHKRLRMHTTAVEINSSVIGVCRLWFRLPEDDARLKVVLADAARYALAPANAGTADALCVDLYDHDAASPVLDDEEFYRSCHQLLAPDGVMTVNLFGRTASFERSAQRIAAAFGVDNVMALKPTKEGNAIVLAGRPLVWPEPEVLQARADLIQKELGLPATKWLRIVRPLLK
jgi:spermidine synthase